MVIKGASRRNIAWWTRHLVKDKENDRVELIEKRGFLSSPGLADMMREMEHTASLSGRCKNFMYIASFNPQAHEHPTEPQWERMLEIFEQQRGIPPGTPRVIVEHEKKGRTHRHVIWQRVDLETMRAFADGHNPTVCQTAAKQIEQELGLERTPKTIDREPGTPAPAPGPKSWEMYRDKKNGLDTRDIQAEVTGLFRQSENGQAFKAALEANGYELVTGDRGLLILDSAGKEHSLARRCGIKAKELNAFMRDVDRNTLPILEQAKAAYQDRKIAGLEADRATVAHEIKWEEKLAQAAIEKEKVAREFVEPKETLAKQDRAAPAELTGPARRIREARQRSDTPQAFMAALNEHGIGLAQATRPDAVQSQLESAEASTRGYWKPTFREGEIVAITPQGQVWQLNRRTTGDNEIKKFLRSLNTVTAFQEAGGRAPLPSIADALQRWQEQQRELRRELEDLKTHTEPELGKTTGNIRLAYNLAPGPEAFHEMLQQGGLTAARVTAQDIQERDSANKQENREAAIRSWDSTKPEFVNAEHTPSAATEPDKPTGRLSDHAREGDVVILDKWGNIYELNRRTTGDARRDAQASVAGIGPLPSIETTRCELEEKWQKPIHVPTGPQNAGLVAQQMWALRRLADNAERQRQDQQRREQEKRRREDYSRKSTGEVDPHRYLSDPDYRREVRQTREYKTPQERKRDREKELRALLEQQDRQR